MNTLTATIPLLLSDVDYNSLQSLIKFSGSENAKILEDEISRATVLPADKLPGNIVCMYSTVTIENSESGAESSLTLVMPKDANLDAKRVSILAPMGIALIGLLEGQNYEWTMPDGKQKRFKVKRVDFDIQMRFKSG